jgi:hypothetical protein
MVGRTAAALGLLVVGFVVAVAAVAVHVRWWGLLLAVVAGVAGILALPPGLRRVAYVAGWLVAVGLAAVPRGEGDYAIAGDLPGYLLLGLSVVMVILALATLPVKPRR